VRRLREHRQRVWHEAKTLADGAAGENRNFHPEEQRRWETLNAELNSADERLKEIDSSERRAIAAENAMADLGGRPRVTDRALNDQFRSAILERNPRRSTCAPTGSRVS
jgi:hypothetical protein